MHFKGTLIWNNLPYLIKFSASVFESKGKLKTLENMTVHALFGKIRYVRSAVLLPLVFISYSQHCRPILNMVINK